MTVPEWKGSGFDGIYVLRITRSGSSEAVTFERLVEGLDGQPQTCPSPGG